MAKPCQECGAPIGFKQDLGRWIPIDPSGGEHWLTCASQFARHKRTRRGLEPGIYPMSPSRISLYRECPQAYRDRYMTTPPIPEDPNGQLRLRGRLGNSLHVRQAAILRNEETPIPDVPLEFLDDWLYLTGVMDRLEWDLRDASIEETLTYAWLDEAMTVEFECRLDFLQLQNDTQAVVTDWKSGWAIKGEAALRKDVQALSNALALFRNFPQLEAVRFQQVHLRHGGEVVGVWFSRDEVDYFEVLLAAEVGRMLRDVEFKPNPYCEQCPPGAHPVVSYPLAIDETGEILPRKPESEEEARQLAEFAFAAQRTYAAAMRSLGPWCDANGPIGPLGHQDVDERSCPDIRAFIQAVEACGLGDQLSDFVQPDGAKLRAILKPNSKKWRRLAEAVEPLIAHTKKTKFEWRRNSVPAPAPPTLEVAS